MIQHILELEVPGTINLNRYLLVGRSMQPLPRDGAQALAFRSTGEA